MGKGSSPRPFTDRKTFEDNFDRIFGKKSKNENLESNKTKPTKSNKKTK